MSFILLVFFLPFRVAKLYGKGTGFALGLLFLPMIFYPILALDDSEFVGEATPTPQPTPQLTPQSVNAIASQATPQPTSQSTPQTSPQPTPQ
ncbi:MAG: DUF5684 domain-containing protein, partial [bacterium]|nr:DUF5684 domain-containing protein [bacterium]